MKYPKAEKYFNGDEVMYEVCDILAPATLEAVINKDNAAKLNCQVIAETSKSPTTYEAEKILKSKNIRVLPDVLLTGGGAYASYFEWLKNLDHIRPGRMTRRWEYYSKVKLLKVIEKSIGSKIEVTKSISSLL